MQDPEKTVEDDAGLKLSVVIPTFRPGDYLRECLRSLCAQSLSTESFEVVIFLNGERSPYEENLHDWMSQWPRLQCRLIYSERAGVSLARNLGIECARGRDLVFLDDDDLLSPSFLEDLACKRQPNGIVAARFQTFSSSIDEAQDDYVGRTYQRCRKYSSFDMFRFRGFLSSACGKLIPRTVIQEARFDPRFRLGEDSLFMFEISKNIEAIILAEPESIYYRRSRTGSARNSGISRRALLVEDLRRLWAYTRLFLTNFRHYDLRLFMSRFAATAKKHF